MRSFTIFAAALTLTAGAAFAQNKGGGGGIPSPLKLTVSGYSDGGDIPEKYTCAAKPPGGSPQIEWSGAPAGTMSFALIFHDGDVHPGKSFDDVTHWIAWNIPASSTGLPADVAAKADLPDGTHAGREYRAQKWLHGSLPAGGPAASLHAGSVRIGFEAGNPGYLQPRRTGEGAQRPHSGERRLQRVVPSVVPCLKTTLVNFPDGQ